MSIEIQQAIDFLKLNGYIVRKSKAGHTKPGSLKNFRETQQSPKVSFNCFKSRLRQAGALRDRRSQGNIDRALECRDRKSNIWNKMKAL